MPPLYGSRYTRYIGAQFQSPNGYMSRHSWTAPAAASATNMLAAHALDGTVQPLLLQPDVPRQIQFVGNAGATAVIPVSGTDIRNNVISENVTLNGTTPVLTVNAYKTLNAPTLTTQATKTVSIGFAAGLGVGRRCSEDGYINGSADGVYEATRATFNYDPTNVSKNFVTFNTAPNGTHNFVANYMTTELYAGF